VFPYWILFSLSAVGAVQFHRSRGRRVQGGPLLIFMALFVALMVGLRNEVGGDWFNYVSIFQDIRHEPFGDALAMPDPGYALLNWTVSRLGIEIWLVNLVCAALFTWGLTKFIRQQPNPWLALVVAVPYLIIVVAMGYTRQAAAIGLILLGLSTPSGQRITRFWIYILFAATFHKTAIIVLPLVALSQTRNRFVMAGIGVLMAGMLYYLFLSSSIDRLLENYVEQEYESQGAGIRVAMNLIPAGLFIFFRERFGMGDDESKLWRNFAWASFAALVLLFVLASSTVVDRLALYLIPIQLIVFSRLPLAFGREGKENGQLTLAIIAYSALVQFVWLTSAANADYWLPYRVYPL
jgi:hypothetical protein